VPENEASHHFILTLQRSPGVTSTRAGVWTPPPGTTRGQAFAQIIEAAFPGEPLNSVVVLFSSLTPNQL
jgi:hypothetical protein